MSKSEFSFHAQGLTKTYGMGQSMIYALRGVDLEVPRGELVVLLEPLGTVGQAETQSGPQGFTNGHSRPSWLLAQP